MDEIDKIQFKSGVLLKARHYLLNQTPTNMVAVTDITEKIVDLTANQILARRAPKVPELSTHDVDQLRHKIEKLDESIEKGASAIEILTDAKGVFDLKPWPPEGLPGDFKPWPPK